MRFDGPIENADLRYISLGAGVQSSVMALMAARGEIEPMPDCAIFADTQWEPAQIYEHLNWLEKELPFPIYRVSHDNIRDMALGTLVGKRSSSIPVFIATSDGGQAWRQCTKDFKVAPIQAKVREQLGYGKGKRLPKDTQTECWMGISRDEVTRVKDSNLQWVVNRWPLIEKMMTRYDCQLWFEKNYPDRTLSRSACIGCPYRSDDSWRQMRDKDNASWADAVDFDRALRSGDREAFGMNHPVFLHRSLMPLDEVDLSTEQDRGQLDMFGAECEGMCGV
jgi:hypothetical protein